MKITEDQVRYVAGLANLQLSEAEIHRFSHDLDQILTHIEALHELDTSHVAPMAQVLYDAVEDADPLATLRVDEERPPLGDVLALANAPLAGSGFFKVPRVIEK